MINANLSQFLDNGWYNECELYYKGYVYFCEGDVDLSRNTDKLFHFYIYKYPVEIVEDIYYKRKYTNYTDELIYDKYAHDEYEMKEIFLSSKIFEGKSFWEVEKEIAWYEEY